MSGWKGTNIHCRYVREAQVSLNAKSCFAQLQNVKTLSYILPNLFYYISFRYSEEHGEITSTVMWALQYADFELEWPHMMVMERHLMGLSLHAVLCLKVSIFITKMTMFSIYGFILFITN